MAAAALARDQTVRRADAAGRRLRREQAPDDQMRAGERLFGYSVLYLFALFAVLVAGPS